MIEPLEPRRLLSVSIVQPLPNAPLQQDNPASIDLSSFFSDTSGTLVFNAISQTPALVTASVAGSIMTLTPVTGASGFGFVSVSASDAFLGLSSGVVDVIRVQVSPSAARAMDVTIGGAGHPDVLSFAKETDGSRGDIHLSGPGSMVLHFAGDGLTLSSDGAHLAGHNVTLMGIDATGTTAASALVTRGHHGHDHEIEMGGLSTDGAFGSVKMVRTLVQSDVSIPRGVGRFSVDVARSGTINLGTPLATNHPSEILFSGWLDENLVTTAPIHKLFGFNWSNSDNVSESFQAPLVSKLIAFGNFSPGLQLSGAPSGPALGNRVLIGGTVGGTWNIPSGVRSLKVGSVAPDFLGDFPTPMKSLRVIGNFEGSLRAPSIGSLTVKGAMGNATVELTSAGQDLGKLSVRRGINVSLIQAAGSIGSISSKFLSNSNVYAGIGPATAGGTLPATAADFSAANLAATAKIGSVSLSSSGGAFINSNIAAALLPSLQLGTTQTQNNGTPFGIATSSLGKMAVTDKTKRQHIVFTNVSDPATLAAQVAGQNLDLGDMVVNII
jgi:hypothetical protein